MKSQEKFDGKYYKARNYRIIREFRGKTQDQVVKETGISKQNVSIWEKGKGNPGQEFIDRLAIYFDVPGEFFSKKDLTAEYLKESYSQENHTYVELPTSDNKKDLSEQVKILLKTIERLGNTNDYLLKRITELGG
jgi:transcriptional regulator with XRE-family HTH domain